MSANLFMVYVPKEPTQKNGTEGNDRKGRNRFGIPCKIMYNM